MAGRLPGVGGLFRRRPQLSHEQALKARPVKLVEADVADGREGGSITVPLRPYAFGKLFKLPEGATKTFELDSVGLFVWERIDGKTSVKQLIRHLAKEFDLSPRQAEVSMLQFLKMLIRRGLVGVPVARDQDGQIVYGDMPG